MLERAVMQIASWSTERATRWRRRGVALMAVVSLAIMLAGCWDSRPVDARDLVLAMGVSPGPHHGVTVSLAIPTPTGLVSGTSASGGGGSGGGGSKPPTYVLTGSGPDMGAAIAMAQADTNRDIYLGQTQIVLFSHRLSAQQFGSAISWLARLGPFDKTAFAAISEAPVATTLAYQPVSTRLGPMYFLTLFTCTACQTVALRRTVWSLEMRTVTPGLSIWLPAVDAVGPNFVVRRIVAFHGDTPIVQLTPTETLAMGYLLAHTTKATLSVPTPAGPVGVRAVHASRVNTVTWSHGRMHVHVALSVMAIIDQLPVSHASPTLIRAVETEVSRRLLRETLKVMTLLQRHGSDPEGFGAPLFWDDPALRPHWESIYRQATLSASVSTTVQNVGDAT